MAIVNGVYVTEPIGDPRKDLQSQYFGTNTRRDMADYSQAALQIKLKELENQFNLDVWNMQNAYNTPAAQMARYQDAGLNPNLIYGQSNTAGDIKSASAAQPRSSGNYGKMAQVGMNAISQMISAARTAREMYDYMSYGRDISKFQKQAAFYDAARSGVQANQSDLEYMWTRYIMGQPLLPTDSDALQQAEATAKMKASPRGQLYESQLQTQEQRYRQLKGVADMIPDQRARQQVLKQLEDYRLEILQGQNDFILDIDTPLGDGFDSFIKMLMYLIVARLQ